jgi:hypothetical protein
MALAIGEARRGTPWLHLLSALLELGKGHADLLHHAERAWASATFSGTRHAVRLAFAGAEAVAAGEAFIAALPEHEFTLPGQLVADAAVTQVCHVHVPETALRMTVEILLLEDG